MEGQRQLQPRGIRETKTGEEDREPFKMEKKQMGEVGVRKKRE